MSKQGNFSQAKAHSIGLLNWIQVNLFDKWFIFNFSGPIFLIIFYAYLVYSLLVKSNLQIDSASKVTIGFSLCSAILYLLVIHGPLSLQRWLWKCLTGIVSWADTSGRFLGLGVLIGLIFVMWMDPRAIKDSGYGFFLIALVISIIWGTLARLVFSSSSIEGVWTASQINRLGLILLASLWLILVCLLHFSPTVATFLRTVLLGLIIGFCTGTLVLTLFLGARYRAQFGLAMIPHELETQVGTEEDDRVTERRRKLKSLILSKRRLLALLYSIVHPKLISDKRERTVALCRVMYVSRCPRYANWLANRSGIKNSGRLTSIKALSMRALWKHDKGLEVIRECNSWQDNPYLLLNAGLISYEVGRIEEALDLTKAARKKAPDCPLLLNNEAYYLTEKAVATYTSTRAVDERDFRNALFEAKKLTERAMTLQINDLWTTASIQDTIGYIGLLLGGEDAMKSPSILEKAISVNTAAKYHLALFLMVGLPSFSHAESLLNAVVRNSKRTGERMLYDLAICNLDKIRLARAKRLVLRSRAIRFHRLKLDDMPSFTYYPQDQKARAYKDKREAALRSDYLWGKQRLAPVLLINDLRRLKGE